MVGDEPRCGHVTPGWGHSSIQRRKGLEARRNAPPSPYLAVISGTGSGFGRTPATGPANGQRFDSAAVPLLVAFQ